MTDFTRNQSSERDRQDATERGLWGKREDVSGAGSVMRVRGTGTVDEEVPVVNLGYSFNIPEDSNAEVLMLSAGGDVNNKVALPQIPRDKQHQWVEGTGGVQHPTDASRRLEYNGDETWLKDGNYKLGNNKEVEVIVAAGNVTINIGPNATINVPELTLNTKLTVNGDFQANGGIFEHNGTNVGDTHVHTGVTPGGGNTGAPL